MRNDKKITINIGPQSSDAWCAIAFFLALSVFFVSCSYTLTHGEDKNKTSIELKTK